MSTEPPSPCPNCGKPIPEEAPGGLCPKCILEGMVKDESPPPPEVSLEEVTAAFPDFEIQDLIGVGGIGRVFRARDPKVDRIVALKILSPERVKDPEWIERFTREAKALARLNHPHIVQVHSFGTNPQPHLVMEFVDGVNLREAMAAGGLCAREALAIVPKLCDALHYAHEHGVLHRDIKPENILVDTDGRVKLVDFGLAKLHDENALPFTLTQSGAKLGTIAYMAPEQIERPSDVDHRADIYSLGVVFYEMLTGELPLGLFPTPSEASGSDPRLDSVVLRTLEKKKEKRYPDAGSMGSDVESIGRGVPPAPVVASGEIPRWSRFGLVVLGISFLIFGLVGIGYYRSFEREKARMEQFVDRQEASSREEREQLKAAKLERRSKYLELASVWIDKGSQTESTELKEEAIREMLEAIKSNDSDRNYAALQAFGYLGKVRMDRTAFREPLRKLVSNEEVDWEIRSPAMTALFMTNYEESDIENALGRIATIPDDSLSAISGVIHKISDGDFSGEYSEPMLQLLKRGFEAEKKREPGSSTWAPNSRLLGALWGSKVSPDIESLIIEWSYLDSSESGTISTNSRAYYAFYSALSVFASKRTPSVERLLELAASPDMNNIAGRCFWGLNGSVSKEKDQKLVAKKVIHILGQRNHDYLWRRGLDLLANYAKQEHLPGLRELLAREEMPDSRKDKLRQIIAKIEQ